MGHDRRKFLQAVSAGAFAASFPSIKRAMAIPAHHRTGTIADVEHIVILMQENRSFDHYFGSMRGVRGFGDPRAVALPNGEPVWNQPNGSSGPVLPYHPQDANLGLLYLVDLPHGWNDTQAALNGGRYDNWILTKSAQTMAYLTRNDIPFHYALADAFTVCDAYHCSFLGATDPNRYHMWTGWLGNDGKNGGPVLNNAEAGYDWSTYPERLQAAGISWKVYQDAGSGLDQPNNWGWDGSVPFVGNYGDNSLLYFHQYQNALPGSPLYVGARSATDVSHKGGTLFDMLREDVMANKLPQVSWIVAPETYTEHGNWPANWGAWYVDQMLEALTSNPEVWSKTVFFLMFDENDGFFDHMVPPTPPASREQGLSTVDTTNEIISGIPGFVDGPVGLGVRVPMTVISPWSKGGWVNSEVFDHTSLIRFIEERFANHHNDLIETNITAWRRAVVGDLTSCFDFRSPNAMIVSLPSTAGYVPTDYTIYPNDHYVPAPPAVQSVPKQEPGVRPARAVPYELHAHGETDFGGGTVEIRFGNSGQSAAVFQARLGAHQDAPRSYTVGAGEHLSDTWDIRAKGLDSYDLAVHGPNGFLRQFKGSIHGRDKANLAVRSFYDNHGHPGIVVDIHNRGAEGAKVRVFDAYAKASIAHFVAPGRSLVWYWSLVDSFGWYDLTIDVDSDSSFKQQLAGHVETGRDSMSDPLLGM